MKIFLFHSFGLACNISAAATSSVRVSTPERRHQQRHNCRSAPQNRTLLWDGAADTVPPGRMLQAASAQAGPLPGSRAADGGGVPRKKIFIFCNLQEQPLKKGEVAAAEIKGGWWQWHKLSYVKSCIIWVGPHSIYPPYRGRHFKFGLPMHTRWEKSFQNVWHSLESGSVGRSEHPNLQQEEWTSSVFFSLTLVSSHLSLLELRYHR